MSTSTGAKSPILAAVAISLAIGLGALAGSAEPGTLADIVTGRVLTRPFTEAQQAHTFAIAALETNAGRATSEIDFVARRIQASIRQNEMQAADRFAQMDAELATLKDKIAGLQATPAPRVSEAPPPAARDTVDLRSSLHDLTSAHKSAVAALTRRLDKVEVMLGASTDTTASIGRKARRAIAKVRKPLEARPISRQPAPLILSTLRE